METFIPDVQLGTVMNESLIVLIIVIFALFGFMYYVLQKITTIVNSHNEYIREKNGHNERIAENFSSVVQEMVQKVAINTQQNKDILDRNEYQQALLRQSLDQSSRAIMKSNSLIAEMFANKKK